jgi:hypothetical protein
LREFPPDLEIPPSLVSVRLKGFLFPALERLHARIGFVAIAPCFSWPVLCVRLGVFFGHRSRLGDSFARSFFSADGHSPFSALHFRVAQAGFPEPRLFMLRSQVRSPRSILTDFVSYAKG